MKNLPRSGWWPKLLQKTTDNSSRRSQKNPEPCLKNSRPNLSQLRSMFGTQQEEWDGAKMVIHERDPRRKPQLTKHPHKGSPDICQESSWWSPRLLEKDLLERPNLNFLEVLSPVKLTQHFHKNNRVKHGVGVMVWSTLLDLDDSPLLMEPQILISTRKSCRRMSSHQFVPRNPSTVGVVQQDDDSKHKPSPTLNGWKKLKEWPSQSQD